MLETSTEIVKSSANIMKESTFSLIRNISNTNFWKSRLNLNFKNDLETSAQHESEMEQKEEDINLQSFPCYYESLHERCRISVNETRYNKYSMTDIEDTKLKCCRALLRITILSESSCYGLETSDINHCKYHVLLKIFNKNLIVTEFHLQNKSNKIILLISVLLECAKHTMPDDWLLGMAYLLSLNSNCILDAQAIFMDLPPIELYRQTALYYYSLELYKKLYADCEKLFLYSPLDLMKIMIVAAQKSEECDIVKALQYWQSYLLGGAQIINMKQVEVKDISALELGQGSTHVHSEETVKTLKSINEEQEFAECLDGNNIPSLNSKANEDLKMAISDDNDAVEWTDDWGDFSDDSIETNSDEKDKIKSKEISQREIILPDHTVAECATEENRFKEFQKRFNQISNLEQYQEVKKLILQWPKFNMPNHITIDNHPVLKMMKVVITLTKTNTADFEKRILREHEELIRLLVSEEVL